LIFSSGIWFWERRGRKVTQSTQRLKPHNDVDVFAAAPNLPVIGSPPKKQEQYFAPFAILGDLCVPF
jgi:hypothetical protein